MEPLGVAILVAVILLYFIGKALRGGKSEREDGPGGADVPAAGGGAASASADIYEVAARLMDFYEAAAHPEDLRDNNADFDRGVRLLCKPDVTIDTLVNYVTGDNVVISLLAIEALTRRADGKKAYRAVAGCIGTIGSWPQYFGLRYLVRMTPPDTAIIGQVLAQTTNYLGYRLSRSFLAQFIEDRLQAGEEPSFEDATVELDKNALRDLRRFLEGLEPQIGNRLLECLDRWREGHIDKGLLGSVGRIWDDKNAEAAESIIEHPALERGVDRLEAALLADRPQSCLVVGERGVGKTALLRRLARRLYDKGWVVFVCGHADLIAGQVYIGQFEEQLNAVVGQLSGERRAVWFIPAFHTLAFSGRHRYSPVSALDVILPLVEQGSLRIVGETSPAALEKLLQLQPRAVTALSALRVEPLPAQATLDLAKQWLDRSAEPDGAQLLDYVWGLAQQYLSDRAAPGNLLGLLEATLHRLQAGSDGAKPKLGLDDVVVTLASQTGLPLEILDHRRDLDLDGLKSRLSQQVLGQEEAVDCLVERVAMMKAGVTDPTRPVGVFLFAGPTGTGKTEIAKTLAEWLFGTTRTLLRLDMSELQTLDGLDRLLGRTDGEPGDSLADQIRQQPFSVLLLDEFEKAHPKVWDTFLQVFDDARITDRRGQTADFRHAVIILTSNLGAAIPTGLSLGFGGRTQGFDPDEVHRAVEKVFRKEFINRLDRVVVFRPLSRDLMREILQKEMVTAFQRRGLKNRTWAVEWDEAAIEFLLEKGFTPDLGARPLKRAVEQYLLSPLAMTIVRHQVPEGDQFLFVSCKEGQLDVTFVDPDAPPVEAPSDGEDDAPAPASGKLSPQSILIQPKGTPEELAVLRRHFERLEAEVGAQDWQAKKAAAFAAMEDPDFWSSPGRFATLGLAEYLDRIGAGVRRAGSLLQRLEGRQGANVPPQMTRVLAQNLHLLEAACGDVAEGRPREAFLMIEASPDGTQDWGRSVEFARRLAGMYEAWANTRRMRLAELESRDGGAKSVYRKVYAVAGFGAYSLLAPERGLHILERPSDRPRQFERESVHVRVAPQADGPPPETSRALRKQAERALRKDEGADLTIVRRYREDPSPLVRDSVRGWRSGRLDLVLAGHFDAIQM